MIFDVVDLLIALAAIAMAGVSLYLQRYDRLPSRTHNPAQEHGVRRVGGERQDGRGRSPEYPDGT